MSDLIEIGRNIVLLRTSQYLTQKEVAILSNRCEFSVQTIEYGHKNATVDTMIQIAYALGVDFRVLGIFSRPDNEIASEFHQCLRPPKRSCDAQQIYENIRLLRKERGLTQKHVAQIAGLSVTRLRDIEQANANTTLNTLANIAHAFDLSLMQLLLIDVPEDELMSLIRKARFMAGI